MAFAGRRDQNGHRLLPDRHRVVDDATARPRHGHGRRAHVHRLSVPDNSPNLGGSVRLG